MKENQLTIREYLKRFDEGAFMATDVNTQIEAGWFDWFCRDESLRNKTISLTRKLKQIVGSNKINMDGMYVFFKNNCPVDGKLYDDFRICDVKTRDVIYTIVPSNGHVVMSGKAEVWGRENDFDEALVAGTWNDVLLYFTGVDRKKEQEEKRLAKEKLAKEKAEQKVVNDHNKIVAFIRSRSRLQLEVLLMDEISDHLNEWAKRKWIIK